MTFPRTFARGRPKRKPSGTMNRLESAYDDHLGVRKLAGEVADFWFETFKFRLAEGAWYTPDFVVMLADGLLEIHETKGHWEEAARVRVKVAADKLPFAVVCITRKQGQWVYERL